MHDERAPQNRLAAESSPYLRLHATNPVDWYPWGEEALARARREDRPIFLSVGYSSCYWCHVMERESFADPAIAAALNGAFVCIKVDREERPDLDAIYMAATQLLTERGGWPNTVLLTPELVPFFAGTYFPPADRHGLPGMPRLIASLADAWQHRRAEVEEQAREVVAALRQRLEGSGEPSLAVPGPELAAKALAGLRAHFDSTWGGFGAAPKFPTPANLFLLLELAAESFEAAAMLATTLDQMARGGLCDQLAGGFHRYATDRQWRVPHFEKMLSDNGLLLEVYARDGARSGDPERGRVARATAEFLLTELAAPEGAFHAAIDAETAGKEGEYYAWTRAELEAVLGVEDAAFAAPLLGFAGEPFFEHTRYVLHRPSPLDVAARERRMSREELLAELEPLRQRLLAARAARPRPATDDKVLTDWNGMAIAGLATAGRCLDEPRWTARAAAAAAFILTAARGRDGVLQHTWKGGEAKVPALLDDYVFLIHGLLALAEADPSGPWLEEGVALAEEMRSRLAAPTGGFFTAAAAHDLIVRPQELFDGATPGANAMAAWVLGELGARTRRTELVAAAEATLRAFGETAARVPDAARTLALAARRAASWRTALDEA